MRLLLDTNVYIYNFVDQSYVKPEDRERWKSLHSKSKIIFEYIIEGKHALVMPAVVKVEVASVINHMTDNEEFAGSVMDGLKRLETRKIIEFGYLDDTLTDKSIALTYQSGLYAMDSIIGANCILRASTLITNDHVLHKAISQEAKQEKDTSIESIYLQKATEDDLHKFLGPSSTRP